MLPVATELQTGMSLARLGNKDEARVHFLNVLKAEPHNETALLWLSHCMPTIEHALLCIDQLLTINPQHVKAREAREVLQVRLLLEEAAVLKQPTATPPAPSTPQRRYLLGEALVEARVITPQQLETALHEQARLAHKGRPKRLGEILLKLKFVRPEQIEGAIAAQIEDSTDPNTSGSTGMIGQFLLRTGLITRAQLHQGLAQQAELRRRGQKIQLGEMLVRCGYLQREQLTAAMHEWQQQYEQWYS